MLGLSRDLEGRPGTLCRLRGHSDAYPPGLLARSACAASLTLRAATDQCESFDARRACGTSRSGNPSGSRIVDRRTCARLSPANDPDPAGCPGDSVRLEASHSDRPGGRFGSAPDSDESERHLTGAASSFRHPTPYSSLLERRENLMSLPKADDGGAKHAGCAFQNGVARVSYPEATRRIQATSSR